MHWQKDITLIKKTRNPNNKIIYIIETGEHTVLNVIMVVSNSSPYAVALCAAEINGAMPLPLGSLVLFPTPLAESGCSLDAQASSSLLF